MATLRPPNKTCVGDILAESRAGAYLAGYRLKNKTKKIPALLNWTQIVPLLPVLLISLSGTALLELGRLLVLRFFASSLEHPAASVLLRNLNVLAV